MKCHVQSSFSHTCVIELRFPASNYDNSNFKISKVQAVPFSFNGTLVQVVNLPSFLAEGVLDDQEVFFALDHQQYSDFKVSDNEKSIIPAEKVKIYKVPKSNEYGFVDPVICAFALLNEHDKLLSFCEVQTGPVQPFFKFLGNQLLIKEFKAGITVRPACLENSGYIPR